MSKVTVDKFIELKKRIDTELKRRKYKYAVDKVNLPYETQPQAGDSINI